MDEAVEWYRRGAEHDDPGCLFHLGMCYNEGLGVAPDQEKALEYLYRAYDKGHGEALEYMTKNMKITLQ